ncbi:hypothetical protein E2C01_014158 [Portunus trituberculatus]|uniref:Uncharacterized protein n=1 Tax=Portunus trituberculatus TaxID=210409 RepID=A0A5B7DI19_PORTR|nr:hypothetical protein [Portunus trituberculatus]
MTHVRTSLVLPVSGVWRTACHTLRPSHWHEVSSLTPEEPPSSYQCLVHGAQRATHYACHTLRPSHWHELSPLTSKGLPSYCPCLVHGAQRALVHGDLFSSVLPQSRDTFHQTLWKELLFPYKDFPLWSTSGRKGKRRTCCQFSALGPRPDPTANFSPSAAPKTVTALNKFWQQLFSIFI